MDIREGLFGARDQSTEGTVRLICSSPFLYKCSSPAQSTALQLSLPSLAGSMASYSRRQMSMTEQQLFLTGLAMFAIVAGATLAVAQEANRVFPYLTVFTHRAAFYGEPLYIVSATAVGPFSRIIGQGVLTPEYDETNRTSYIRLSEMTAHNLIYLEPLDACNLTSGDVTSSTSVRVRSFPSGASWGWRNEGETQWFLVLCSPGSSCDLAVFNIVYAGSYACARLYYCEYYSLVSAPGSYSSGLAGYLEDGVTYIQLGEQGTQGTLPIAFVRPRITPSNVTTSGNHARLPA